MGQSTLDLLRATGPIARGVIGVLGAMSIAAGAIAAEKWLRLRRAERASDAFLAAWREKPDEPADVTALSARFPESPIATLVATASTAAALANAESRREVHDRTVRRFAMATSSDLRRGLAVLATVGSTAPFVGLFGTVIGIVDAFREIGATGHGGVTTVSSGIAEALVTTAFGLMVAIPAVWLFNYLSQRIGRLLVLLECVAEDVAVGALADNAPNTVPTARTAGAPPWR